MFYHNILILDKYLMGDLLYGDDFNDYQLKRWFEEESNAYYNMYIDNKDHHYEFYAVDALYGFKNVISSDLNVLGIGSGNGDEFYPILDKISKLTIIESSDKYSSNLLYRVRLQYLVANYKGDIDAPDNVFDLITCFSVLHHIANVSFVISEIARVLKKGGLALLREPIISMGDWRQPRKGLTKNERGIPLKIFREIIQKNGLTIVSEKLWNFRPFLKMFYFYKGSIYNNIFFSKLDGFLSRLFSWNINYYPKHFYQRFAPSSVFYVLKKI